MPLSGRLISLTVVAGLLASPAYAYLDPGTGSILVQAVLAALAVASAGVVAFWARIRQLFSKKPPDRPNDAPRS
ncbi:MAG TPA: hypothetical protein VI669_10085 [Vicinamibacteria bacterium]